MMKNKRGRFILLYGSFFIYSLASIASKCAAQYEFLSINHLLYTFLVFFILFIYMLLWQQVLKQFKLCIASANKSIVIVFGLFWSYFIFAENITLTNVIGSIMIVIGIVGVSQDE